ncbi:MAG: protein kinase domain-containing protein, partial [Pyrinomonadaceae bacterium]
LSTVKVMPSCPQCGADVAPTDRFCGYCGATQRHTGSSPVLPQVDAAGGPLSVSAPIGGTPVPVTASAPLGDLNQKGQPSEPLAKAPVAEVAAVAAPPPPEESTPAIATEAAPPVIPKIPVEESTLDQVAAASAGESGAGGVAAAQLAAEPEPPEKPLDTLSEDESAAGAEPAPAEEPVYVSEEDERRGDTAGSGRFSAAAEEERARRYESTGKLRGGGGTGAHKQLEAGAILHARYEIARRIGGGGMGAVYLAKDRNLGDAPRAVKEMIQSQLDEAQHEKAVNDFRRESMLLASLEHSSIPTIYDYFYEEPSGRFYLVMKFISGGDFLARLRNAPQARLDEKTVADWGMQVADVLDYLHSRNPPIIYRDLKPANLMIDGNSGRVMLIDFGIARWVSPQQEKGVTAVGTMGYAPPELFSGKVEARSDVYSLGATMFHLLTGSDPQDNPLLIFDFHKYPRPRQINPSMSNEIEAILMRAVEYKPENRFRSAAELRGALAEHLERLRAGHVTYGQTSAVGGAAGSAGLRTTQTEMVYCGFCGGRIAADDVFCAHCGQRQPLAVSSATLRTARATAKLVVMGTTELDSSFSLHKENSLVGRSDPHSNIFPEVDLTRFDPQTKISRRHARIYRRGDVYLVEDLGSVNGTVVNEDVRLAPHQPRALENGDRLRLGETILHFLIG